MIRPASRHRTDNPVVILGKAAIRRLPADTMIGSVGALANARALVHNRPSSCLVAHRRAVMCRNPTLTAGITKELAVTIGADARSGDQMVPGYFGKICATACSFGSSPGAVGAFDAIRAIAVMP